MIRFTKITIAIILLFVVSASDVMAKSKTDQLKDEIQELKKGQDQIQKDLEEIKKLLQQGNRAAPAKPAFKPTDMKLGDAPTKGESTAPVTLVEFSDYHCPYCKRHAETVMRQLQENYIDTGKLRFVMRENPIPTLHPRAHAASVAVLCGGDQGDYWGMHDALFGDQKAKTDEAFKALAESIGLDAAAFDTCLGSGKFDEQIKADQAEGQKLGISGTPSFVMGLTDPKDSSIVHLTKFIRGAQPYTSFSAAVDEMLKAADAAD
jgi:protein-disulfide isomerase